MAGFLRAGLGAALGMVLTWSAGCNLDVGTTPTTGSAPATPVTAANPTVPIGATPAGDASARGAALRIATFNIQVFGQSKLDKPEVMEVLVRTMRKFDLVAIQEVRSTDQNVLPRFVQAINADGSQYAFLLGPRLGRTNSKEQYAFVYDTRRVVADPQSMYTIADPQDLLHREPLVARFQAAGLPASQAFTFTLINIHTDPDETDQELNALDDVFRIVQGQGEDDVILLGDLNVDDRHLGELGQLPGIAWVVSRQPTNTRRSKQYDNLVYHSGATIEYTGAMGVLDMQGEFGLSMDQALEVSDHLPVWAEFNPYENQPGRALAARPPAGAPR